MSKNPDFTKIAFSSDAKKMSLKEWQAQLEKKTGKSIDDLMFDTMEQIALKPLYTKEDYEQMQKTETNLIL